MPRRAPLSRAGTSLAVAALYVATSVALFGWRLGPHPGRDTVGLLPDPEIFIWSLAWWAHAITTLTNPFVTNVVYHPVGVNLMWTASAPGLGLALVPLTLLVGPTAAYNVAMLLLPALGAWSAFLLCRYASGSTWGSVVGGYLFGFSSYVVAHLYGGDLRPLRVSSRRWRRLQIMRSSARRRNFRRMGVCVVRLVLGGAPSSRSRPSWRSRLAWRWPSAFYAPSRSCPRVAPGSFRRCHRSRVPTGSL